MSVCTLQPFHCPVHKPWSHSDERSRTHDFPTNPQDHILSASSPCVGGERQGSMLQHQYDWGLFTLAKGSEFADVLVAFSYVCTFISDITTYHYKVAVQLLKTEGYRNMCKLWIFWLVVQTSIMSDLPSHSGLQTIPVCSTKCRFCPNTTSTSLINCDFYSNTCWARVCLSKEESDCSKPHLYIFIALPSIQDVGYCIWTACSWMKGFRWDYVHSW